MLEVGQAFIPNDRQGKHLHEWVNNGMTKAEIRKKFDEIVDFAGVERYIDTPVKRYSSD